MGAGAELRVDVAVVGGGLSGLRTAQSILRARPGTSCVVFEAAEEVGGRTKSCRLGVDTGGIWLWDAESPLTAALAADQGLKLLRQPNGEGLGNPLVIEGGASRLSVNLADEILKAGGQILTGTPVTAVSHRGDAIHLSAESSGGSTEFLASAVVMAVPPRIALKSICFSPDLSSRKRTAMLRTPAWMSKASKLVLVYKERWWDARGGVKPFLSDGGPGFQFYDASTPKLKAVVVAFAIDSESSDADLAHSILGQLRRQYGEEAGSAIDVEVKRWCHDQWLNESTTDSRMFHLDPDRELSRPEMDGRLFFAGTEAAPRHPGLLEGAVEAADAAARLVLAKVSEEKLPKDA